MGLEDLFSALPRKNSPEKMPGEAPLDPKRVNALLASIEEYKKTMPIDKAVDLAISFGKWGEGLPDDGSRSEYGALAKEYYRAELRQDEAAKDGRKAA